MSAHPLPLDRSATVLVAGSSGLVGSAIVRRLRAQGFTSVAGIHSADVDLTDGRATLDYVTFLRPAVVIDAAARVGGIAANDAEPVEFLNDNLRIQTNLFTAAHAAGVDRLLFLGSSCIYPKHTPQPIPESALLTGSLEETNDAYAIAKIAGVIAVRSYRRQYGRRWISVMPTNVYGPGDNFHPTRSHVLPALIRRFHEAVRSGTEEVVVWGTGTPRREFIHVDDLAAACMHLLDHYDDPSPVNIGVGEDLTIADLVKLVADAVGFTGRLTWDTSRPDGTPRKLLDVSRLLATGWRPRIGLPEGVRATVQWYADTLAAPDGRRGAG
ncbi:GDP-L-fucose synthase family protein [Streptomyces botrytidirepellens]|uniref:GDP-L-fucose synthase n=1 Tax=Streptomyces botrytidirepellens TaxID=2486417 RepID=A0A3M8WWJ5_9ACTN|nr:GDP-L-fucose synthase [Streptomyces botrytidirepellens]RNG32935.1 GDP-L-fucose synthase [Streptomyces botrytidirepellens]